MHRHMEEPGCLHADNLTSKWRGGGGEAADRGLGKAGAALMCVMGGSMVGSDRLNVPAIDNSSH